MKVDRYKNFLCRLDEQQCHDTCHGDPSLKKKCIERTIKRNKTNGSGIKSKQKR